MHTYTQRQNQQVNGRHIKITYLLTAPEPARGVLLGLVANFRCFPAVQKFWTSVTIWQSYRQLKGGNFFWDTVDFTILS